MRVTNLRSLTVPQAEPPAGRLNLGLFCEVVVAEWQEIAGKHTHESLWRFKDYAHLWIIVSQNLPIASARAFHPSTMISNCHDVRQLGHPSGAGGPEGDQFSAGATSEVVEVHACKGSPVLCPNGSTHCVHAIFTRTGIGGCLDCLARKFD